MLNNTAGGELVSAQALLLQGHCRDDRGRKRCWRCSQKGPRGCVDPGLPTGLPGLGQHLAHDARARHDIRVLEEVMEADLGLQHLDLCGEHGHDGPLGRAQAGDWAAR